MLVTESQILCEILHFIAPNTYLALQILSQTSFEY